MKNKFYLDIYSLPSIDYQDNVINKGHPFSVEEYNIVVEKIYSIFRIQIQEEQIESFKSILRVADRYVISNVANYLKYKVSIDRLKDFDLRYSDVNTFKKFAGSRNLTTDFLQNTIDNLNPFIDYWMRDFFYNNLKSKIKRFLSKTKIYNRPFAVYGSNPWMLNFLKENNLKYNVLYDEYFWDNNTDPKNTDIFEFNNFELNNLSDSIIKKIIYEFQIIDIEQKNYIEYIVKRIFYKVNIDLKNTIQSLQNKKIKYKTIYTGTAGNYKTRIILESLKKFGINTGSFMHSGSISHVEYNFDSRVYIEYSIPNQFFVFNQNDIQFLQKTKEKYKLDIDFIPMKTKKYTYENKEIFKTKSIKNIVYTSVAFSGQMRFFGVPDDLMHISFEYNLFRILTKLGDYNIKIKTHPKGVRRNDKLLLKYFKNIEIIDDKNMTEVINTDVDIFINKMIDSTAFNEIVQSNKPMILINDTGTEKLTDEAKEALKNRVAFVDCHYENGLAIINEEQLKEALNREYVMDFEFANRFQ